MSDWLFFASKRVSYWAGYFEATRGVKKPLDFHYVIFFTARKKTLSQIQLKKP